MNATPPFGLDEILAMLPHRAPFLFVDRVIAVEPYRWITGERRLQGDEAQFLGHFPGQPIMPGVLVAEALAQVSGLLLALSDRMTGRAAPAAPPMYYLAGIAFKFSRPARPGDLLLLHSANERSMGSLFHFRAEARVGADMIATGTLTLAKVG